MHFGVQEFLHQVSTTATVRRPPRDCHGLHALRKVLDLDLRAQLRQRLLQAAQAPELWGLVDIMEIAI